MADILCCYLTAECRQGEELGHQAAPESPKPLKNPKHVTVCMGNCERGPGLFVSHSLSLFSSDGWNVV